jgi:NNP family putative nitrate transporter
MIEKGAIWKAGFATIITTFQLVILETYIVIFLSQDLLTAIMIITIVVSLRNLLQLILRVPFGDLSQILGRKPVIIIGHFSLTSSLIAASIANTWFLVLISTIFMAVGMSAFWPNIFAYIGDLSPEIAGENLGRIFQMSDFGSIIGLFFATVILDELLLGLKELFGILALVATALSLLNIIILPEVLKEENKKQVPSIPKAIINSFRVMLSSLKDMTRTKGLAQVFFYQFILSFTEFAATTFLPLLIIYKGFTRGDVSEIGMWTILAVVWFKPFLGRLTDKFNFTTVITTTLSIYCFFLLIFTFVPNYSLESYLLCVVIYIILNASLITAYMAESSETSKRAPVILRGTAQGALGFYVSLGRSTSTIVLGPIWEVIGLLGVFYFTTIFILAVTVTLWFVNNARKDNYIHKLVT